MAALDGKVRKIRYYKYPFLKPWQDTMLGTQHGEVVISFKPKFPQQKETYGFYRIGDYYFAVERLPSEIFIVSLYKTKVLSERTFRAEEAQTIYNRWSFCSLPTIVRYFGETNVESK